MIISYKNNTGHLCVQGVAVDAQYERTIRPETDLWSRNDTSSQTLLSSHQTWRGSDHRSPRSPSPDTAAEGSYDQPLQASYRPQTHSSWVSPAPGKTKQLWDISGLFVVQKCLLCGPDYHRIGNQHKPLHKFTQGQISPLLSLAMSTKGKKWLVRF